MDKYVSTKKAAKFGKVGLTQHRIAEMARHGEIVAHRTGKKKWLVKVTFNDGQWELVPSGKPKQKPADSVQSEQEPYEEMEETVAREVAKLSHFADWEHKVETQALNAQFGLAMEFAQKIADGYIKKLPKEEREDFKQELALELLKRRIHDSKQAMEIARELWLKLCSERHGSFKGNA